jgi:ATP-dependent Clp protease adaptor protein ClpS
VLTGGATWHDGGMAAPAALPATKTDTTATPETDVEEESAADRPWVTIVNLMSYVTFVLQKLFGYSKEKAEKLMLDVHHKGRAVVSAGQRERMEHDASQLHAYGLWATVSKDS